MSGMDDKQREYNEAARQPPSNLTEAQISMNSSLRIFFAVIAMLFFSTIIVYLIMYGKAENSLHQSALSWSFLGDLGILAALGFGTIVNMLPYIITKK